MTPPPYTVAKVTGALNSGNNIVNPMQNATGAELNMCTGYLPRTVASDAIQAKANSL